MLYILLPSINHSILEKIKCISSENEKGCVISNSLSFYLYDIKNKINSYGDEWDIYRKYTNPFEWINSTIPNKLKCVSKYKPLSRSYFKMIEIMTSFDLYVNSGSTFESNASRMISSVPISSFHLAEGPGGFIEALLNVRKNPKDKYIGMTILDDKYDTNIPGWKKSDFFLRNNPNVTIENGATGTGDILCMENFRYCIDKYGSSMDLITADGGFDFSTDFNNQESNITKLLFGQICYAVCMQKKNGHFILKIFDCFMQHTIDLLYILSALYEEVYITKPNTSRYANSEKYIVCKNFIFKDNSTFIDKFADCFQELLICKDHINGFLSSPISNNFLNKIEEYNAIFGQQQLDNIYQTIMLIDNIHKNNKIENYTRTNINKCINWCINHNVAHNTFIRNTQQYDSGWD